MWYKTGIKSVRICNYKFHFKVNSPVTKCFCNRSKHTKNYCKVKEKKYCYSVFKSGFINVTGIKHLHEIKPTIQKICKRIGSKTNDLDKQTNGAIYVIDNITVTGVLCVCGINLSFLHAHSSEKYTTKYNNLHFPGLFLKINNLIGTVILFQSGKFNIVGLKCFNQITPILREMVVFILLSQKIYMKELSSA